MNVKHLKAIADSAIAYGKTCCGNKHEQYADAKRYIEVTQVGLHPDEYEFVIKRIVDKLGI